MERPEVAVALLVAGTVARATKTAALSFGLAMVSEGTVGTTMVPRPVAEIVMVGTNVSSEMIMHVILFLWLVTSSRVRRRRITGIAAVAVVVATLAATSAESEPAGRYGGS